MIGVALFVAFIVGLGAYYLFGDYRGLTNRHGIDQAQIARELSRGNGYNTKFLRPFALFQARQKAEFTGQTVNLDKFEDTFHAPLGPLVNAGALYLAKDKLAINKKNILYPGDRIISAAAMILLLVAILVYYLLSARIFDKKIAVLVVTLMVLCDMLWRFTHTGLPTSLLLLLFGFALFFLYKAVENQEIGNSSLGWAALSAAFFGLMALSHWITIWIFIGALVYIALALRPRGMVAALMAVVFIGVITPGLVRNYIISGNIHGDAFYAIYDGLGGLGETGAMRNFRPDKETLNMQGFGGRIATSSVDQLKNLVGYLGAILAAPLFFISLLHPFRRPEIASFRWGILAMWLMAVLGMAVFGLPDGEFDANQMHILFAPVMAAYGLAMVAILWNRANALTANALVRNLPFIVLVFISSIGIVVNVPRVLLRPGVFMDFPNYRPYLPQALAYLSEWTDEKEAIVTDMPWGTAWYCDRSSVWLPKDNQQFDSLVEFFDTKRFPVGGIYFSPVSTDRNLASEILDGDNSNWAYWVVKPQYERAAAGARIEANFRYGVYNPMGREMGFWSNYDRSGATGRGKLPNTRQQAPATGPITAPTTPGTSPSTPVNTTTTDSTIQSGSSILPATKIETGTDAVTPQVPGQTPATEPAKPIK